MKQINEWNTIIKCQIKGLLPLVKVKFLTRIFIVCGRHWLFANYPRYAYASLIVGVGNN